MNPITEFLLFAEKTKNAIYKRVFKRKQKTYEDWAGKEYLNDPKVSFIIQSHNKSISVKYIVEKLREYKEAEIVVIDDGSSFSHTKALTKFLHKGNEFLIRSNDLYENIMYDKSIRFANGEYIVLLQDDDKYEDLEWVDKAVHYFTVFPQLAIIGGCDGLDFQVDKGLQIGDGRRYSEENGNADFRFVHIVNRSPMIIRKSLFTTCLKHIDFSFAPFQSDDCELCLRAWLNGLQVGWFKVNIKSIAAGGMRIWNNSLTAYQGEKNTRKLYQMYHSYTDHINGLVEGANKLLKGN